MRCSLLLGLIALCLASPVDTAQAFEPFDANEFCAQRTWEQYLCSIDEGSVIIGNRRVYCAHGLECYGEEPGSGYRIRGYCRWKNDAGEDSRGAGVCHATHFAGLDQQWHPIDSDAIPAPPLSQGDIFETTPGNRQPSLLSPFPAEFQSTSFQNGGRILDAFPTDAPQPLTSGEAADTGVAPLQPNTSASAPPTADFSGPGVSLTDIENSLRTLTYGLPPEGYQSWSDYLTVYNQGEFPPNSSPENTLGNAPAVAPATGFGKSAEETAVRWYQSARTAAASAWDGVTYMFSSYENYRNSINMFKQNTNDFFGVEVFKVPEN